MQQKQTLYDKLWQDHLVYEAEDGMSLIYIDRHLVHEVTSPQAFEGLKLARRTPWRPGSIMATADHSTPTRNWDKPIQDQDARLQVETLDKNIKSIAPLAYYPFRDKNQGIVHVVGPENGAILPGMSVVCGDSHTSTHGAFGCLAHGIGTSEVEHVLATQCLIQRKLKSFRVNFDGKLPQGVFSKDMILALIGKITAAGGTGYAIEFSGQAVRELSMEGRMTLCNMAIEAGAKMGCIGVDQVTIDYLANRLFSPKGDDWVNAVKVWRKLHSDEGATFDREILIPVDQLSPQVTWGTGLDMVSAVDGFVPHLEDLVDADRQQSVKRALDYMDLSPGQKIQDVELDRVFIGSCTNSRIEDLRVAAKYAEGHRKSNRVKQVLVVPGSGQVKRQAEEEGLDEVFKSAGFEWREPGCSMCLGMNEDQLQPAERCASTSNRNFEGRQGAGGRTHLVSPAMAVGAAIAGHFVDIRSESV